MALDALQLLDTPPAADFDRIASLAAQLLGTPMAAISLIDGSRQWFKSRIGIELEETPRDWAFCAHTILTDQVMVVNDAQLDPRFATSPLVTGPTAIRFYAGAPLRSRGGFNLGAVCVMDTAPRAGLSAEQQRALADLASLAAAQCELHQLTRRRMEAESEQDDHEERYRIIAETAPDAIITRTEGGDILSVNSAAEKIFGYTAAEMIGQPVWMLIPEPWKDPQDFHRVNMKPDHLEAMGRHKSGREIPVYLSLGEYTRAAKRIFTAIVRDETERKRAEAELVASELRYRTVVDNIKDVIFQTDGAGSWTFLNPAWTEITGYSVEESLGRDLAEFLVPEDRARETECFRRLVSGQQEYSRHETRCITRAGAVRSIEVYAHLTRDAAGAVTGISGTLSDFTERHETEEQLRAAKEEAERASKAKDDFLSRVSHELRTPMNSILGFAQLLEMDDLTAEQKSNTSRILKAGRHLLSLLNEILNISQIEAGRLAIELEQVDPVETLRAALELVQPMLSERSIGLSIGTPENADVRVLADRQRLTQVFLNLLSNAVKYNRANGQVVLSYQSVDQALRIKVTDTGRGISPELQSRLFQPFERLGAERSNVQGTGLGLALAKRMVELMRGNIGVESTPGIGSTFWIELPRIDPKPSEAASGQVARPAGRPGPGCSTVLYIEDNVNNIGLIESILKRRENVRLIFAMQGNLGLEMASIHAPNLILLDLHLPDLSGFQVLQRLREDARTASIPVVVITADALPGTQRQAMETGACAYLSKPIDVQQFLAVVNPLLERSVTV